MTYLSSSGAPGTTYFERSVAFIDDSWFDGTITAYFQFVATNTDSSDRDVHCATFFSTVDKVTVSVPSGTTSRTLFESSSFSLTSGSKGYGIGLDETTSNDQLKVYSARLVIVQTGATKTAQQYMITAKQTTAESREDRGGIGVPTSIWTTNNTSYADTVQSCKFLLTKDNWDTVSTWKFWSWVGGFTAVRLVDASNNQIVEHSKPTSGSEALSVDFSHSATDWEDGVFHLQAKTTFGGSTTAVFQCYLVAIIDPIVKCKAYIHLDRSDTAVGADTYTYGRSKYRGLGSIHNHYLVGNVQRSVTEGAQQIYGFDAALNDSGTTGTNIGQLTPTTSNTVIKSSLIDSGEVPDEGDRVMFREEKTGAGSTSWWGVFLMAEVVGQISISVGSSYIGLSGSGSGTEYPFIRRSGSDTFQMADNSALNMSGFIRVVASGSFGWSSSPDARMFDFIRRSGSGSMMFLGNDSISGSTSSRFGRNVLVLGSVITSVGTEYFSKVGVRHPNRFYRGEVMNWGSVNRSIPAPAGVPRVGNIIVNLADTDLYWRQAFAQASPKNRRINIKLGLEGQSESQFLQVYGGQVTGTEYPPVQAQILAADITSEWFKETIPPLITKQNFPNKRKGEMFAPIVFGEIIADDGEGAIPIFECDKVQNRLCIARHPISSVTIYRKRNLDKDAGFDHFDALDDAFEEVSSINYDLIEEDIEIDGVTYTFTFAEFNFGGWFMGKNTEWRMDCTGITDDRTSSGTVVRNFAECIKIVLTELGGDFEATTADLDLDSFTATAALLDTNNYLCDGAVIESMTYYDLISRLVISANLDFFQNISGQIAVSFYTGNDSNRPVFTDLRDIIKESVHQQTSVQSVNKFNFFYSRNYGVGTENAKSTDQEEWGQEQIFNNEIDQDTTEKEVEQTFELWFVRSTNTADKVIADVASYLDETSLRLTFETPGPLNVDRIELGIEIGITHYGGLESTGNGFVNEPFKVIGLDFNLDTYRYRVTVVRRITPKSVNQTLTAEWINNLRAGPWRVANGLFYGVFRDPTDHKRMKVMRTSDFGTAWAEANASGFTSLSNDIVTADSHLSATVIHVLTQESDGRTAYHRFNTISNTWDIYSLEVTPSTAGVLRPKASLTVLTGGSICLYFTGAASAGGSRSSYRLLNSSGTTFENSTTGVTNAGRNDRRQTRVLAGSENRAHFYYQGRGAFNDELVRTLNTDGSLGASHQWLTGNLIYYSVAASNSNMGVPSVFTQDDGTVTMRFGFKGWFGDPYFVEFVSKDNLNTTPPKTPFSDSNFIFEGNSNSSVGHGYPAHSTIHIDGTTHQIAAIFPNLIQENWEVYKTGTGPVSPPHSGVCDDLGLPYGTDCGVQHKAGFSLEYVASQTIQCSNVHMYKYGGKLYMAKFTGMDLGSSIAWQHLDVAVDIPSPVSFDRTAFLADLG